MDLKNNINKNNEILLEKNTLENKLNSGQFVITCELGPPKGTNMDEIKANIKLLKENVDAVNVSDNQGSNMNLGGLALSHILLENGLNPVYQITCRDKNRLALQSDLLSAYVLGVRNLLVLTGDYTTIGDTKQAKPVFDLDSVQLLWVIKKLEEGYDMVGNPLKGKPAFFKGAAVNPEVTNTSFELQIIKMKKKVEMGAQFFQTMPIFNTDKFKIFIERVKELEIKTPIIAGIQLIKSEKMANYMNKYIPGVNVPKWIIEKIASSENRVETSVSIATEIINKIKPICSGIHIGAQGWEQHIPILIKNFTKQDFYKFL